MLLIYVSDLHGDDDVTELHGDDGYGDDDMADLLGRLSGDDDVADLRGDVADVRGGDDMADLHGDGGDVADLLHGGDDVGDRCADDGVVTTFPSSGGTDGKKRKIVAILSPILNAEDAGECVLRDDIAIEVGVNILGRDSIWNKSEERESSGSKAFLCISRCHFKLVAEVDGSATLELDGGDDGVVSADGEVLPVEVRSPDFEGVDHGEKFCLVGGVIHLRGKKLLASECDGVFAGWSLGDRENLAEVLKVGLEGGVEDKDVIKLDDDTDFEEVAEDVVHGRLEGSGGIGESEWHHEELVVVEPRAEGGLVGVLLAETDLMEATVKVDLESWYGGRQGGECSGSKSMVWDTPRSGGSPAGKDSGKASLNSSRIEVMAGLEGGA
ncbi:hypothetical protein CBR_g28608 [Chara braunii]|uniref:Uncharacterized protein n=1 Tax=Chara braunii TaxID=69332 RepID=A0A388L9M9_CHABU|nr:hypothetical protein CBR_g28608 [Chara braunii]|eukprot:GBG78893.1 hypothetical protein CBR_g28608 [Chara braunii]